MADDDDPYAKYLGSRQVRKRPPRQLRLPPLRRIRTQTRTVTIWRKPRLRPRQQSPRPTTTRPTWGWPETPLTGLPNTGTLGALDYGLAGLHAIERGTAGADPNATDLTQIQKENQEWGQAHPYLGLAADVAGYGLGAGKLGLGGKLATKLGGSVLARMAGAGLENAGASVVSDELGSQGQASVGDLLKSAALSGTVGGIATGGHPRQ